MDDASLIGDIFTGLDQGTHKDGARTIFIFLFNAGRSTVREPEAPVEQYPVHSALFSQDFNI